MCKSPIATWQETLHHVAIDHGKLFQALKDIPAQGLDIMLSRLYPEKWARLQQLRNTDARPSSAEGSSSERAPAPPAAKPRTASAATVSNVAVSEPSVSGMSADGGDEPELYVDVVEDEDEEYEAENAVPGAGLHLQSAAVGVEGGSSHERITQAWQQQPLSPKKPLPQV